MVLWWKRRAYLVGGAAGQRAHRALDGAGGLVEVRLSGGSLVLVGRHGCCYVCLELFKRMRIWCR